MNTFQLYHAALSDPCLKRCFGGVYASDTLPPKRRGRAFIINLDKSSLPGSHWVAVYFKRKRVYYYDPYGIKPFLPSILNFIKRNNIQYNKIQHQSPSSESCGYYCLYFLYRACRDLKIKKLNDNSVRVFFKKHFDCGQGCVLFRVGKVGVTSVNNCGRIAS